MRPVPIPDGIVWPNAVRRVISPPDGDLTNDEIRPVEALIDQTTIGLRFSMLIKLEEGELEAFREAPYFWVGFIGNQLHPFIVEPCTDAEQLVLREVNE